jgi:hypothetical protein
VSSESTSIEEAPLNRRGLIPVWAPLLVMVAVILTGIVLGEVGTVYLVLFAVSAIVCTALVELRGLFLTVVLLPFYWFFGVTGVGMVSNWDSLSSSPNGRKAALIGYVFPAVTEFLWLAVTFVICLVLAVIRYRIDVAAQARQARRLRAQRKKMSKAEAENQRLNSRVRDNAARDTASRDSSPRDTASRSSTSRGSAPEDQGPRYRTRTSAELREASERRRRSTAQSQLQDRDRPLDLD